MEQEQVKVRQVSSFPYFDNVFISILMVERLPDIWMDGLLGILKKELSYMVLDFCIEMIFQTKQRFLFIMCIK